MSNLKIQRIASCKLPVKRVHRKKEEQERKRELEEARGKKEACEKKLHAQVVTLARQVCELKQIRVGIIRLRSIELCAKIYCICISSLGADCCTHIYEHTFS